MAECSNSLNPDAFSCPSSSKSSSTGQREQSESSYRTAIVNLGEKSNSNTNCIISEPRQEILDNHLTTSPCSSSSSTADTWSKSLKDFPPFSEKQINNQLIYNSKTMPDSRASSAHRNKMHGYRLWKEGYVKKLCTKADVLSGIQRLFLVKANVSASMKQQNYLVYCHLNQLSGEVVFSKCHCKAGQGGCCKHVAAVLYTLLDYKNLQLEEVPDDVTCTQVLQQWSIPSNSNTNMTKAVKFEELTFEKADYGRDKENRRKRPLVKGKRENYCSTPPFAKKVKKDEIKALCTSLQKIGKCAILCETLLGNKFEPNTTFETSCTIQKKVQDQLETGVRFTRDALFENMPQSDIEFNLSSHTLQVINKKVGVTKVEAITIEAKTRSQRQSKDWFIERQKRLTSSLFGRVVNRRESASPVSLIESIKKANTTSARMPPSIKWGIDNEPVALEKYRAKKGEDILVADCGLVINPAWPWLACSPDGIIYNNEDNPVGAVEIKCPFSKKEMTIEESCKDSSFYLKKTFDGLRLKQSHVYYYQCQGVLNITGLPWIDFVVYTKKDLFIQRIARDINLWNFKILPKLTQFYAKYLMD